MDCNASLSHLALKVQHLLSVDFFLVTRALARYHNIKRHDAEIFLQATIPLYQQEPRREWGAYGTSRL